MAGALESPERWSQVVPVYVRDVYLTILDYNSVPPRLELYRRPLQNFRISLYTTKCCSVQFVLNVQKGQGKNRIMTE